MYAIAGTIEGPLKKWTERFLKLHLARQHCEVLIHRALFVIVVLSPIAKVDMMLYFISIAMFSLQNSYVRYCFDHTRTSEKMDGTLPKIAFGAAALCSVDAPRSVCNSRLVANR